MKTCPSCATKTIPTKPAVVPNSDWCPRCKAWVVPEEISIKTGLGLLCLIFAFIALLVWGGGC